LKEEDLLVNTKINGSDKFLPVFFENIDYQVHLNSKTNLNFEISFENNFLNANLAFFNDKNSFSGSFNFRNYVGMTKMSVSAAGRVYYEIFFTVFSTKMDYIKDRRYMIQDLQKIQNQILYSLFKPSNLSVKTTNIKATGLEWLNNYRNAIKNLEKLVIQIENVNYSIINKEDKYIRIDRLKKNNSKVNKIVNRIGKTGLKNKNVIELPMKIANHNTRELQYIKSLLKSNVKNISKWIEEVKYRSQNEKSNNSKYYKAIIDEIAFKEIEQSNKRFNKRLDNRFWSIVANNANKLENKVAFNMNKNFIKIEKVIKDIGKAVEIHFNGNKFISTVPLSTLYEYWTFLKILEIITALNTTTISEFLPKVQSDLFMKSLIKGKASKVVINKNVKIYTNRLFRTTDTDHYFTPFVAQKPDMTIEVESEDTILVLDAKYKIQVLKKENKEYKILKNKELISVDFSTIDTQDIIILPKDEDINTMHRYRDAILVNVNPLKRAVFTGIIIYPIKPINKSEVDLQELLNKINRYGLGAIPLSPGVSDTLWESEYNYKLKPDNELKTEQIRILAKIVKEVVQ